MKTSSHNHFVLCVIYATLQYGWFRIINIGMRHLINIYEAGGDAPDLSFLQGRIPPDKIRLLTAMNRSHLKGDWFGITPLHLVPFWFGNEKAPKGFAKVAAPSVPPERLRRIMALYYYSKQKEPIDHEKTHRFAAAYVNAMLWMTIFPTECERHYKCDEVFNFDPEHVEEWLQENMGVDTIAYACLFDMRAADPVRIAYNQM